jgi:excisionase family DNA binding protein
VTRTPAPHIEALLTPREVAALWRVDVATVTRWWREGKMPEPVRTPGGHRRWRETDIRALRDGVTTRQEGS